MSDPRVVVIGAGPGGLATAVELGRRGIPAIVLEQSDGVGASWRGRYDRLRLNSSRWFSTLPRARYARGTGVFPARDEVVGYLEAYATGNGVDVRLGTSVERIDRAPGGWVVRTSAGDMPAEQVVVAAGYERTPVIPDWPGRERFQGPLIHSAEYRNPEPFRGGDVLVVGPGCSGAEIAYDLADSGARRVRLSVRTPPNFLIRTPIGPLLALILYRLPPHRADALLAKVRAREIGDLTEFGLPEPEEGVFTRLRRLGVTPTIVDEHVLEAIRERRIEIVPSVESLDETGVTLAGGDRIEPDAVIAATGWRCGLEPLVGHLGVLTERGLPHTVRGETAMPGLRFVGYVARPAQLSYMGREAKWAAQIIERERNGAVPGATAEPAPVGAVR